MSFIPLQKNSLHIPVFHEEITLKQKSEKSQKNRDFSMHINMIARIFVLFRMEITWHSLKKQQERKVNQVIL